MKKLYGVKIIMRSAVEKENHTIEYFYEELIVSVNAENIDDVFYKARKYAEGYCDEHENPYGETVKTEIYNISDCFEIFDEEDDVREVYSKFYFKDGTECSSEELKALRYKEFNGSFEKDDVKK